MDYTLRNIEPNDAEPFWQMMNKLDYETEYMMYEPGERKKDIDRIKSVITKAVSGENLLLIAEVNGEIAGYISAERGELNRIRHCAYIVTGIRAAYRGCGIGSAFFRELDKWADSKNLVRLELTVMCNNTAARHLYEKNGFTVEGIKKRSMLVDGVYTDEYYMAKILHNNCSTDGNGKKL